MKYHPAIEIFVGRHDAEAIIDHFWLSITNALRDPSTGAPSPKKPTPINRGLFEVHPLGVTAQFVMEEPEMEVPEFSRIIRASAAIGIARTFNYSRVCNPMLNNWAIIRTEGATYEQLSRIIPPLWAYALETTPVERACQSASKSSIATVKEK